MFPTFENYTKQMYEGNEPAGKKLLYDRWLTKYGDGESCNNELVCARFNVNNKVCIYIIGAHILVLDIRYAGKTDVWQYSNDGYLRANLINEKRIHELEKDKLENVLNTKIDCRFWQIVQKRAKALCS